MSKTCHGIGAITAGRSALLVMVAAFLVAGCAVDPRALLTTSRELREQTPFTPVAISQSWINAPGIVMVVQRGLRGESQQRVALDNRSGIPGENVIIMRSQNRSGNGGRLVYEEFMRSIDGPPEPFTEIRPGDLITAEDDIGPYFWVEQRVGDDAVCVLGIRRITSAQRLLPGSATVLDILLRNCIQGEASEALAPLSAGSVSAPPIAGVAAGDTRVISPLAAPVVR